MRAGRFATVVLAAFASVAVLGGVYVGGYRLSGIRHRVLEAGVTDEFIGYWTYYDQDWQVRLFTPAASVEGWLTGLDVRIEKMRPEFRGQY